MSWSRRFDDPIAEGEAAPALKDAAAYILKLPKAKQKSPEWPAAMEALIPVATSGGPTMFALKMRVRCCEALRPPIHYLFAQEPLTQPGRERGIGVGRSVKLMKTNLNLKATLVRQLTPGELFAYDVDGSAALGIFLAKNPYGYDAVALTHAPRDPAVLPSPFAQLPQDATVLGYETTTLSAERRIKFIGLVKPGPGAIA